MFIWKRKRKIGNAERDGKFVKQKIKLKTFALISVQILPEISINTHTDLSATQKDGLLFSFSPSIEQSLSQFCKPLKPYIPPFYLSMNFSFIFFNFILKKYIIFYKIVYAFVLIDLFGNETQLW